LTPLPRRAALPKLLPIRGARRERARRHAQEEDCRRGGVDDEVLEAWEKDVVRENERVLVVRERARQQCFGGEGDSEGREGRDWERERTGPLFCEKRAVQNGRQHTMCHKPFYLKI